MHQKLPPGFVYDRPVPPEWQAQLAQLAPKSELHPWLLLAWLPGDPWDTETVVQGETITESQIVQRWCIYEMVPLRIWIGLIQQHRAAGKSDDEIIEAVILQELNDRHPRDRGAYDVILKRFVSDSLVTRQEWELFHQHKAVPKLFWIIQGSHGGHKRVFTQLEQKYLGMARLPQEPPDPGTLPYAEFDQRVLMQLARRDRLHKAGNRLSPIESERDQQLIEFRRQLMDWVSNQVRTDLESAKLDLSGIPTSGAKEDDPTGRIEEAIDRFIQTGSSAPPPQQE